jgi:hypothetical protein
VRKQGEHGEDNVKMRRKKEGEQKLEEKSEDKKMKMVTLTKWRRDLMSYV